MTQAQLKARNYCFTVNNPNLVILNEENELIDPSQLSQETNSELRSLLHRTRTEANEDRSSQSSRTDRSIRFGTYVSSESLPTTSEIIKGVCGQLERGTNGTLHFQGYLELGSPQRIAALKKLGGDWNRAHFEPRKGTRDQAVGYCTSDSYDGEDKGRQMDPEWWPEKKYFDDKQQGRRTDLHEVAESVLSGKLSESEIALAHPISYIKFNRGIKRLIEILPRHAERRPFCYTLKDWQQAVLDIVNGPVQPRLIYWFVDLKGNAGKTTFALYLTREFGAYYTTGGKHDRLYHSYGGESIVIFDFARTVEDVVPYGCIENLKNGVAPRMYGEKILILPEEKKPFVFVFANFPPNTSTMSEDRWNIINL